MNLEQLKMALNLVNIRRFQTHRLLAERNVAEHSFRAGCVYAYMGGKEFMPMFLHDSEESLTGDLPSPIKKDLQGLEKYESLRPQFQDKKEERLGKLADKLELVLTLREQLEDTGRLPRKLMDIYETELELAMDIAKELGKAKDVKKLLKELGE